MTRALFGVFAIAACVPSRPTTATSPVGPGSASTESTTTTPPPDESATTTPPPATTDSTTTVPPAEPTPPAEPLVPGSAAHCLLVGPEQRVVRCYWERKACDEQIAFNKESGVDKSQECKGVAQAHCFVSDTRERCLPSAAQCGGEVASIRAQNRQASDCVAKTHP